MKGGKVNFEKQMHNIELFDLLNDLGFGKEALTLLVKGIETLNINARNEVVDGKRMCDYDEFKTLFPIFFKIQNGIIDEVDVSKALGIDLNEQARKFSDVQALFHDVLQEMKNEELLVSLDGVLSYSMKELNRIIRAVEEYDDTKHRLKKVKDNHIQRRIALDLYSNSYEIYLKILKEIYSKIKNINPKRIINKRMYTFYEKNYPVLREKSINVLRNDESHLNYDVRDNYTTDDLFKLSKSLVLISKTALMAKNESITNLFKGAVEKLVENWDFKKGEKR